MSLFFSLSLYLSFPPSHSFNFAPHLKKVGGEMKYWRWWEEEGEKGLRAFIDHFGGVCSGCAFSFLFPLARQAFPKDGRCALKNMPGVGTALKNAPLGLDQLDDDYVRALHSGPFSLRFPAHSCNLQPLIPLFRSGARSVRFASASQRSFLHVSLFFWVESTAWLHYSMTTSLHRCASFFPKNCIYLGIASCRVNIILVGKHWNIEFLILLCF